jgi:hypothetical protein
MTADEEHQLLADVRYLKDRQEILDVVNKHARGCDRHDAELVAETYSDDGFDEHGTTITPGKKYGYWANETHSSSMAINMHNIATHTCEIEGDVAHAETYAIGLFLNTDGVTARCMAGRYLDRLERRNGKWEIVVRRSTTEVCFKGDASIMEFQPFLDRHFPKGTRDRSDLSYVRPLQIDSPAETW